MPDPEAPEGIHPLGQPDARFPVFHRESVPNGLRVIAALFEAIAGRNAESIADLLHFPFASYEGTEPEVIETREQFLEAPPKSLNVAGEGVSHIQDGAYDLLDGIELYVYNPVGAGLSMTYSRFGEGGHKILQCDGVYAVTNNDGRWGIQLASTIFTPRESLGVRYPDVEQAAMRRGHDWMLGYTLRDQSVLNSTQLPGRRASAGLGNPRVNAGAAREGDPMRGYRIDGVTSRLAVTEATPESIAAADANFPQFAEWAGGGVGQWDYTMNLPTARVLHSTVDKAHVLAGYQRYTTDSQMTSETRSIGITVYRDQKWGMGGSFGVMMYHDLTNDLPR